MKSEIGSEFWNVPTGDSKTTFFPKDTKWFISGTSALKYILEDIEAEKEVKSASLPSWCCSCMITPFIEKKLTVSFYDVYFDEENGLSVDFTNTADSDITLVLSYFGYSSLHIVGKPSGLIIRDITHSIFTSKVYDDATYYFGSIRKWMGVWTGGFAYKKNSWMTDIVIPLVSSNYVKLRESAMLQKMEYLDHTRVDKHYLEIYEEAENYLDLCEIEGAASRDVELISFIDIPNIVRKRRANAEVLISALSSISLFPEIKPGDCPLFVPILLDENIRNGLRGYLISKKIYCPIHWGVSEYHSLSTKTEQLYKRELSLVCDQRYDTDDMYRIIEEVTAFMAG